MAIIATCPSCGAEVPWLANFCPACGTRLGSSSSIPWRTTTPCTPCAWAWSSSGRWRRRQCEQVAAEHQIDAQVRWRSIQAEARAGLGEVLRSAGRHDEAARQFERTLQLYERKGNVMAARHVRSLLVSLRRN